MRTQLRSGHLVSRKVGGADKATRRMASLAAPPKYRCRGCNKMFVALGVHLGHKKACRQAYYQGCEEAEEVDEQAEDAATSAWSTHYQSMLTAEVFKELSVLFFVQYIGATLLTAIVSAVTRWIHFVIKSIMPEIKVIVKHEATALAVEQLLMEKFTLFKDLDTEWKVNAYAKQHLNVLAVRENVIGPGKATYGVLVIEWLVQLMRQAALEHP